MMLRSGILTACALLTIGTATGYGAWPFSADGPRRGTPEYYEMYGSAPIGERQKYHHGKLWPPFSRPCGPPATCVSKYHHNLYWPHPYICEDRESVRAFVRQQTQNGWEQATTLFDYHFDKDSNELNSAGREHVFWIMSQVPYEFRNVYVSTSRVDPTMNDIRVTSTQNELSRLVGFDETPQVMLRVATPTGTPATDVFRVFDYRNNNLTPAPEIPYGASGGGTTIGG